jgi:hypothetical protein
LHLLFHDLFQQLHAKTATLTLNVQSKHGPGQIEASGETAK